METSHHLILQNTKDICWYSIFREVLLEVYIHSTSSNFIGMGLGLRLGDIRESEETGDSGEEEDTQWRQAIT